MIDSVPGSYLYATRIRSGRGLVSYVWLEFLPAATALAVVDPVSAGIFLACHYAFLSLYELTYLHNDRSATASERDASDRPAPASHSMASMATSRLPLVACLMAAVGWARGPDAALAFAASCAAILCLALLHTWVGVRWRRPAGRCATFTWLAAFKYLPALLASTEVGHALSLCLWLFMAYGGGRVVEYAIAKHGGVPERAPLDINASWFVGVAPLLLLVPAGPGPAGGYAAMAVLGTHHVAATALRWLTARPGA